MRTAIVILTLNAEKYGTWDQVLQAAAQQDISDCARFILDSFSGDDTCTKAKMLGWQIFKIKREKFNHGNTRNRICRILHKKGFAQVIFLTQDAILTQTNSGSLLVDFLKRNELSGCYGRQISWQKNRILFRSCCQA